MEATLYTYNGARGAQRPMTRHFNVTVTDNSLEIRFHWASRGTARIPYRGDYGSQVSAISVNPYFKICSTGSKKNIHAYIIVGVLSSFAIFMILGILWRRRRIRRRFDTRVPISVGVDPILNMVIFMLYLGYLICPFVSNAIFHILIPAHF
ncbi:probable LRR receptor-like serine/threonine-protein kinase At1g07650 [Olea europaea var. sylvestris]|uniref:probable LRR receptor-like serine/threonine-protein kinase At1g07650 n=1 Tax=Olea europaea var. sylvestris TaxID=158386 RepID=UPI000C1D678F|nr:probable LRR receptor-like serine/threonine-protein kinase At1g07650 [Olea europaea var. sylvestris]